MIKGMMHGMWIMLGVLVVVVGSVVIFSLGGVTLMTLWGWWERPSPPTAQKMPPLAEYQRQLSDFQDQLAESMPEDRLAMADMQARAAEPPQPWVLSSLSSSGLTSHLPRGQFDSLEACELALHRYADPQVLHLRRTAAMKTGLHVDVIDRPHFVQVQTQYGGQVTNAVSAMTSAMTAKTESSVCYLAREEE